ncbi:MAG: hypothetical protein BroJett003_11690 [Planctomycetota bacterium]|nr:MAG: hypothetical protein BroJett003_11690 [Planctomycetota bacterium]
MQSALPSDQRRTHVIRDRLDRFLFRADDIVVAVGQDGLVANVAKYLHGQLVAGISPDPEHYDGVLCPHGPHLHRRIAKLRTSRPTPPRRCMPDFLKQSGRFSKPSRPRGQVIVSLLV